MIQPYVKSGNVTSVQSAVGLDFDPADATGSTHSWAFGGYSNAAARSYGINGAIVGSIPAWGYYGSADTGPGSGPGGNSSTAVSDPAGTIMVATLWSHGNGDRKLR